MSSSTQHTVRAPGKLVLAGEYAVLDDQEALVQAIDRGVRCDITSGPSHRTVRIITPHGDDRFVAPALTSAPVGCYRFSSWNPVDLPGKPGFGGSAAACVAACLAAGRPALDALAIHHAVQGSGSGVDVLASALGGTLLVRAGQARPATVRLPVVIYSGRSAKTGPRVQCYRAWSHLAAGHADFLRLSQQAVDAMQSDPIAAARAALRVLTEMSEAAGIAYMTPGLVDIARFAQALGGAAKPSGAGGGDVAVAWLPDEDRQQRFIQDCAAAGLAQIAIKAAAAAH